MLNQRRAAVVTVAPELFATESDIDKAIHQSLKFAAVLLSARKTAGLAATVGSEAIDEAGAVLAMLFSARRRQIACHEKLAETHTEIGLGTFAYGSGGQKPDQSVSPTSELRAA